LLFWLRCLHSLPAFRPEKMLRPHPPSPHQRKCSPLTSMFQLRSSAICQKPMFGFTCILGRAIVITAVTTIIAIGLIGGGITTGGTEAAATGVGSASEIGATAIATITAACAITAAADRARRVPARLKPARPGVRQRTFTIGTVRVSPRRFLGYKLLMGERGLPVQ